MKHANNIRAAALAILMIVPSFAGAQLATDTETDYLIQSDMAKTTEMTPLEICGPVDMSDVYYTLCMFYHGFALPDIEV